MEIEHIQRHKMHQTYETGYTNYVLYKYLGENDIGGNKTNCNKKATGQRVDVCE